MDTLNELNQFLKDNDGEIMKKALINKRMHDLKKIMIELEQNEKIAKEVKGLARKMGVTDEKSKQIEQYSYLLMASLIKQKILKIIN